MADVKCTFIPAKLFEHDHGEVIRSEKWGIRVHLVRVVGSSVSLLYPTDCSWEEVEVDEEEDEEAAPAASNMQEEQRDGSNHFGSKSKGQRGWRTEMRRTAEGRWPDGVSRYLRSPSARFRENRGWREVSFLASGASIWRTRAKKGRVGVPDSCCEGGRLREVEGQPAADCDNLSRWQELLLDPLQWGPLSAGVCVSARRNSVSISDLSSKPSARKSTWWGVAIAGNKNDGFVRADKIQRERFNDTSSAWRMNL